MLSIIVGKQGGGKSYMAVEVMLRALREGAIVHSNLPIVPAAIMERCQSLDQYRPLPDDPSAWIGELRGGEEGAENCVFIDESQITLNARDWNKAVDEKREVFNVMTHARKEGLEVYFVTQSLANIDAQIRRMAEKCIQCVDLKKVPPIGWLIAMFRGRFARYVTDSKGKTVYETTYHRFRPEVGAAYYTRGRHTGKGLPSDIRRQRLGNPDASSQWKVGRWVAACVLLLGCGAVGVKTAWGKATANETPVAPGAKAGPGLIPTPAVPPAASQVDVVAVPAGPLYSLRSGSGSDHRGRKYVSIRGEGDAWLGGIFREKLVERFSRDGDVVTIHLRGGPDIKTLPATWAKSSPSPSSTSVSSSRGSVVPSLPSLSEALSKAASMLQNSNDAHKAPVVASPPAKP